MNKALDLIEQHREDEEPELCSDVWASVYFKQGYKTDRIYEDNGFTGKWSSWPDSLDPQISEVDGNHFTFLCPECDSELINIKVDTTGSRDDPQLNFHLYCKDCRIVGSKKIYLRGRTSEKVE